MEIPMITINTETFVANETPSENAIKYGWNEGTIEATFMGKTRRVNCLAPDAKSERWAVYGLCARYATGTKVWHATVTFEDGKVSRVWTGFDNRSRRYSEPRLCGFIADVGEQHVSRR
jgi:hypothetical protein